MSPFAGTVWFIRLFSARRSRVSLREHHQSFAEVHIWMGNEQRKSCQGLFTLLIDLFLSLLTIIVHYCVWSLVLFRWRPSIGRQLRDWCMHHSSAFLPSSYLLSCSYPSLVVAFAFLFDCLPATFPIPNIHLSRHYWRSCRETSLPWRLLPRQPRRGACWSRSSLPASHARSSRSELTCVMTGAQVALTCCEGLSWDVTLTIPSFWSIPCLSVLLSMWMNVPHFSRLYRYPPSFSH